MKALALSGGELHDRADPTHVDHAVGRMVGGRQQVDAGARLDDQALQELGVEAIHVLERVEQRESRIRAEEDCRIAVGQVQVDEQRRALDRGTSTVATLTAVVVVPRRLSHRRRQRPDRQDLRALTEETGNRRIEVGRPRLGLASTSLTPARIPSSINAGSSDEASRMTLVAGCCRFSAVRVEGN